MAWGGGEDVRTLPSLAAVIRRSVPVIACSRTPDYLLNGAELRLIRLAT